MEEFDIFDEMGNHVGTAPRSACHGNPALIHRTAHVVVFSPDGKGLLLQKRSRNKDIQPGKWDTAVGGHLQPGETPLAGAQRELAEELGIRNAELTFLFESRIRNEIESENVSVFGLTCAGPFSFPKEEIDEVRFWSFAELNEPQNFPQFTPNLCKELETIRTLKLVPQQKTSRVKFGAGVRFAVGFLFGMVLSSIVELIEGAVDEAPQGWLWLDGILPLFMGLAAVFFFGGFGQKHRTGKK